MANPPAPGDVLRGTQQEGTDQGKPAKAGTPQRFAQGQSFADPVHKGGSPEVAPDSRPSREVPGPSGAAGIPDGGLRTQETSQEEGAKSIHRPDRPARTTTSRGDLAQASEEEE